MPKSLIPLALCYDFDGTLAPGNMQERDFIPAIGMKKGSFWKEVKALAKEHEGDEILMYMRVMLEKAEAARVEVRRQNFMDYGKKLQLFKGVPEWFSRINTYGKEGGFRVTHHVISSGIREMILGTSIKKHFKNVYASSFLYDHHGIAKWPALALNYTTKTQYLFRINKGVHNVYEHDKVNEYVPPEKRAVPFTNIVFIGDGETDIPCFRLEPISKSFEEDDEAGELHEAKEVLRIKLPADKNAALPLNPGEEPFDQPAPGISAKSATILRGALAAIGSVRRDHLDAVFA